MQEESQKKVLALMEYIRQVCALKYRIVSDIRRQEWMLYPDKLGFDAEKIHYYPKRADTEENVLLEVERPSFLPCPALPNSLVGWIATPKWNDFHVEEVAPFEKLNRKLDTGDVTIRFDAVAKRMEEFDHWKQVRSFWRNGELEKERTQELFDELYRIYEKFRQNPEELELMAGDGFFFNGLNPEMHHPLILKRVRIHYDKRGVMQILDTDAPTEFYTDIFYDQECIDGDAIRSLRSFQGYWRKWRLHLRRSVVMQRWAFSFCRRIGIFCTIVLFFFCAKRIQASESWWKAFQMPSARRGRFRSLSWRLWRMKSRRSQRRCRRRACQTFVGSLERFF